MPESVAARYQKKPQHDGENKNEHRTEREIWKRYTEQTDKPDEMIDTAASAYRRHHTERYGREDRESNRSYGEFDRSGVTAQNGPGDRFLVSKRNAQIPVQDTHHVRTVLSQNRLIQSQVMPYSFDLRGGSAFTQHLRHRIA